MTLQQSRQATTLRARMARRRGFGARPQQAIFPSRKHNAYATELLAILCCIDQVAFADNVVVCLIAYCLPQKEAPNMNDFNSKHELAIRNIREWQP